MKKNKIILEADTKLIDKGAREMLSILETRIETINERTKNHTIDIRKLKKLQKDKK